MNLIQGNPFDTVKGNIVIGHFCSNTGMFGTKTCKEIAKRFFYVKKNFISINPIPQLQDVVFLKACPNIVIANMVCISGIYSETNQNPFTEWAMRQCLITLRSYMANTDNKGVIFWKDIHNMSERKLERIMAIFKEVFPSGIDIYHD